MSSSLDRKDLAGIKITALKTIAKAEKVPKWTTYKAGQEQELIDLIVAQRKKLRKDISSTPSKAGISSTSSKAGLSSDCNIPSNVCEKSNKYKKDDIKQLAARCGVKDLSGSRKQLCERIAQTVSQSSTVLQAPLPVEHDLEAAYRCFYNTNREKVEHVLSDGDYNSDDVTAGVDDQWNRIKLHDPEELDKYIQMAAQGECPTQADSVIDPPVVVVEQSVPVELPVSVSVESDPPCIGGTYAELIKKKTAELRQLLIDAGVTKGLPEKKDERADYLCNLAQNGPCDPANDINCPPGKTCDVNAGVCLDENTAQKRGKLMQTTINGRAIIGTPTALAALQKTLASQSSALAPASPRTPPKPQTPPGSPPVSPLPPLPPLVGTSKLVEGADIIEVDALLQELQESGEESVEDMPEVQLAVKKCLGLIA